MTGGHKSNYSAISVDSKTYLNGHVDFAFFFGVKPVSSLAVFRMAIMTAHSRLDCGHPQLNGLAGFRDRG